MSNKALTAEVSYTTSGTTVEFSPAHHLYQQAEQVLFDSLGLSHQEQYIELSYPEMTIRTLSIGKGSPVLVVVGGIGNAAALAPLFAELQGFQFITLDRPGAGLSGGIDHRLVNLRRLAVETLESVLDAYELDSVPVISNSMGGLWALWLGLDRPERVKLHAQMGCPALILSTSAPMFMRLSGVPVLDNLVHNMSKPKDRDSTREGLKYMGQPDSTIAGLSDEVVELFYQMYQVPTYDLAWKSLMHAAVPMGLQNAEYSLKEETLRKVHQPVQFVWGDNDPFGDLEVARQVCDILPDARLHTISGGHLPWLDAPQEVAEVFGTFIHAHQ
jgi:3-oxoadipate enol-lactonase